ncbi:6-phosphofructokinase [candidate division KSB1 bacterium]|nr:6-phosphofructokinase [candidate division KSB1 bacterium]
MTRIGVLTSGGDAPGMNACVRAVVRTAIFRGCKISGIMRGYAGLLNQEFVELDRRSVSNIIQRGGTIIKTSRCKEMHTREGREKAGRILKANNIDGLIVIGGDGSFRGAHALYMEENIPVIGIPGTIDNDLYGTDNTLGYDTAVDTAISMIDKIRDTADSHDRLFYVEVMGHSSGFIGLNVGVAGGAEEILLPENKIETTELSEHLIKSIKKGKTSLLVVVAEGKQPGDTIELAQKVKEHTGIDFRVCVLGHIQRGGAPNGTDRLLATKMGYAAVHALLENKTDVMVGEINNQIIFTPLEDTWTNKKPIDSQLLEISKIMAL